MFILGVVVALHQRGTWIVKVFVCDGSGNML